MATILHGDICQSVTDKSTIDTKMVTTTDHLATVLFGKTRRALLALLLTRPTEEFYLRQIVRVTGMGLGPVQRDLLLLSRAGIVGRRRLGMHVLYQANAQCPIFDELKGLVIKTVGLADVLRAALNPLASRIQKAFIFGSFARGEQHADSDVDLLVVSDDLTLMDLVKATKVVQSQLGREINPILYRSDEYEQRVRMKHHFLTRIAREPKIPLIGVQNEPGGLAEERMAASPSAQRLGDKGIAGSGGSRSAGLPLRGPERRLAVRHLAACAAIFGALASRVNRG